MISVRLKQIIDYKGFSSRAFALRIGVSSQVFGNYLKDREPSYDVLKRIIETFDDINADWLITGQGNMLKDKTEVSDDLPTSQQRTIEVQAETINRQSRIIEALTIK